MEFLKNLFTNDNSIIGLCGFEEKNVLTKIRDKEREHSAEANNPVNCLPRGIESGVLDSETTGRLARSKTSRLRRTAFNEISANLDLLFPRLNYAPPVNLMYKNREHLKNIFGA